MKQELASIFIVSHIINSLGFAGHMVCVATIQFCRYRIKTAIDNMQMSVAVFQ